jgi:hypothetical protein
MVALEQSNAGQAVTFSASKRKRVFEASNDPQ